MSLSSPDPPQPMDPGLVADKQQKYNTDSATSSQAGSMVNQFTPYGALTYSQTGTGPNGVPIYTSSVNLSPAQQKLLDTLQGTQDIAGKQANRLLTDANYGGNGSPADIIGSSTSGLTKDLLDKQTKYLNPFFTNQTEQLDVKLRNQGLMPSPSSDPKNPSTWGPYERAMNQLQQNQNQSVTGFLAQAEPEAYKQSVSNYLLPLSTAATQLGISHPTLPAFRSEPGLNIQPANYQGAVNSYQDTLEKNYKSQMDQQNAMMSGIFGMGGNLLGGWARGGFAGLGGMGGAGGGITTGLGAAGIPAEMIPAAQLAMESFI